MPNYLLAQLDDLPPTPCPCGSARRAFVSPGGTVASVHLVDICADARPHYHRRLTEIYLVLEGKGELELDGERVPVKPLTAVYSTLAAATGRSASCES
jgi:quercetin dioxygenase-like cupin family protein